MAFGHTTGVIVCGEQIHEIDRTLMYRQTLTDRYNCAFILLDISP